MEMYKCNLKEYRKQAGLTQDELAEKVNVRRETIIRIESGKYNPSLKMAVEIAQAVKKPIEEIFVFR